MNPMSPAPNTYSKRCWFTFQGRDQVEQPIIWQMSRKFPDVIFDIRQASVQHEIGIMAALLTGKGEEGQGGIAFVRTKGVPVAPVEKGRAAGLRGGRRGLGVYAPEIAIGRRS